MSVPQCASACGELELSDPFLAQCRVLFSTKQTAAQLYHKLPKQHNKGPVK